MTNAGITKHTRAARAAVVNSIANQAGISERTVRRLMMPWRTISGRCGCGESPAFYTDIVYNGRLYGGWATVCSKCAD